LNFKKVFTPSEKTQANVWQCPDLAGARLCRRPAAAIVTLLRLTLRAQPRSEELQIRTPLKIPAVANFDRCIIDGRRHELFKPAGLAVIGNSAPAAK